MTEWISVEDRLPETEDDVLCYFGGNVMAATGLKLEDLEKYNIRFWMPLPEPPKE